MPISIKSELRRAFLNYLLGVVIVWGSNTAAHDNPCEKFFRRPLVDLYRHLITKPREGRSYRLTGTALDVTYAEMKSWDETAVNLGVEFSQLRVSSRAGRLEIHFQLRGPPDNIVEFVKTMSLSQLLWLAPEDRSEINFSEYRDLLLTPLGATRLRAVTTERLARADIHYVGGLLTLSSSELAAIPYVSTIGIREIEDFLAEYGLKPGLDIMGWPPPDLSTHPLPNQMTKDDLDAFLEMNIETYPGIPVKTREKLRIMGLNKLGDVAVLKYPISRISDQGNRALWELFLRNGIRMGTAIPGWPQNRPDFKRKKEKVQKPRGPQKIILRLP